MTRDPKHPVLSYVPEAGLLAINEQGWSSQPVLLNEQPTNRVIVRIHGTDIMEEMSVEQFTEWKAKLLELDKAFIDM